MAVSRDALKPRRPAGMGKGLSLALLVHAGLLVAIAIGVSWKSRTPDAVEAELWAAVPQTAAPRPVEPRPPPAPTPPPPPAPPVPAPPPPPPPPPKVVETPPPPPAPDPQIAIEKARLEKEKLERDRKLEEEREREQALREKQEREKVEREKAEREKQERERQQALREKQEREKERQEAQRKKQEAEKRREAEEQKKRLAEEKRAEERLAAARKENLERIMGQAGATGGPTSTGTAQQSAGPSSSYGGRVRARVKPNIVFADDVPGNPTAEVEVRAAPDGAITGKRLVKSSGVREWDEAVLRAIDRTATLPQDVDGRVPPSLIISFRVRD